MEQANNFTGCCHEDCKNAQQDLLTARELSPARPLSCLHRIALQVISASHSPSHSHDTPDALQRDQRYTGKSHCPSHHPPPLSSYLAHSSSFPSVLPSTHPHLPLPGAPKRECPADEQQRTGSAPDGSHSPPETAFVPRFSRRTIETFLPSPSAAVARRSCSSLSSQVRMASTSCRGYRMLNFGVLRTPAGVSTCVGSLGGLRI